MRHALKITLLASFFSILSINGYASDKLMIDGSTGVKPLVESLVKQYKQTQSSVVINIGTGLNPQRRIQALIDNEIDIAMASHGVDIQRIAELGLKAHRIAKMAVVMGVNRTVSIEHVSSSQLCDIYNGRINNWHDFDGPSLPIKPLLRPHNEVDTEVVSAHIACFSEIQFSSDILTFKKSGQMAKAIMQTPGAVGMTTLVRVAQSSGKIKALSINGVSPDTTNLLNGTYPLTRDSFLITHAEPTAEVGEFLVFVRSEQGSAIITSSNAVPAN
jgi:phosphate transport system substrate-binding protein